MKISNIKVTITEKDIYSIITDVLNDYVDIDGLKIDKILVDKNIYVLGSYKYKITIPFELNISINSVSNNVLTLSIDKIKVKSLKIYSGIVKIIFKAIQNKVENLGIIFKEEYININFEKLCKVIPKVDFRLENLEIVPYGLRAELSDFNFVSEEKSDESYKAEDEKNEKATSDKNKNDVNKENKESFNKKIENINEYTYRKFRKEFEGKVSNKYKKVYPYVVLIPDIVALFLRLYKDNRVTKETKANISIALGYLFFPLDIIPDAIPFIGKIDDVAVVFYVLQKVLCDIPKEVVIDNWEGEENIIDIASEAIGFLQDKLGTKEIKKVIDFVRISSKKIFKFFVG
ncbi:MAG: YkvA family protein [Clostridium sp.]|nr:YkvA family protein [Clostridium sp.]